MIIAGIDAGVETTKAVIMKDGKVIGRAMAPSGGIGRPVQAKLAYEAALKEAGVGEGDVEAVYATGKGKFDVPFAQGRVTDTIAAAFAARFYYPDATSVLGVGADETLAATLGDARLIDEFVVNQKCTAGLGTFLRHLAKRFEMTIEETGLETEDAGPINEGCVVFSELDALSLLNNGAAPKAAMASAVKAVAVRAANVMNDLTKQSNGRAVLMGGLTKNALFVRLLEELLGFKFLIPDDAEYSGAIGAAISGGKVS